MYLAMPKSNLARVLGGQLLRSGTSVGAQYREACRAKSDADFINKMEGALQELEETQHWLELLEGAKVFVPKRLVAIRQETDELISIFVTIVKKRKDR